jgi:hypothetical protein
MDDINTRDTQAPKKDLSPASILFWRHVVGMLLLSMMLPPWGAGSFAQYLGAELGKFLPVIALPTIITILGWLFFTDAMKNKLWKIFIVSAWMTFILSRFVVLYGFFRSAS